MTSMCNLWCFLCCSACWSSSCQEGFCSSQGLPGEHLPAPRHRKSAPLPTHWSPGGTQAGDTDPWTPLTPHTDLILQFSYFSQPTGSSETESCRTWETEVWPWLQTLNVWVFSETYLVFNRDELEILLKSSTFSLSFFFFFKLYFLSL